MGPHAALPNRQWMRAFASLALAFLAGCATLPCANREADRRALRRIPEVPAGHLRADRAILAAFLEANGLHLSLEQGCEVIAQTAPRGRMDRNALRRIARDQHRALVVVQADETLLWDELVRNHPLLILLPPGTTYSPAATPLIPVAWDRGRHLIELLDGNGEIQSIPDDDFFARREPLKQAALRIVNPSKIGKSSLTREQQLLLADFWFERGDYKRANQGYKSVAAFSPDGQDIESLIGQGNVLFRKRRFKEAIPVFRAALALDPDNPRILNNLAYAMLNGDGELLTALRHATKASQLDPHNPFILETVGSIQLKVGEADKAAATLELAWARALKQTPEVQIAIMDQLTRAWLSAGRRDLAWQIASHRRRNFPDFRLPKDILATFPELRNVPQSLDY